MISYDSTSTANFVHELSHAGQFETQDLAFDMHNTKRSLAQDWKDEVEAYKTQFAYDPFSIPGLISPTFDSITKYLWAWWDCQYFSFYRLRRILYF